MSVLNQLFNRGVLGTRCKTCLNLAISRIKLLQNRRDAQLKQMRKEIAQFLLTGQEAIARIRVEHVIREQNIWEAYEILEMLCEFILARVPVLESQRQCPSELQEAIASVIFAAPRCSDLPDLLQVKNLFTSKYGKEFISAVSELRPDTSVNRTIIENLSVNAPSAQLKLKLLKEIAKEFNVNWDSSETEAEFQKKHDDLLDGRRTIPVDPSLSAPPIQALHRNSSPSNVAQPVTPPVSTDKPSIRAPQMSSHNGNRVVLNSNGTKASNQNSTGESSVSDSNKDTGLNSSDIFEKARVAITSADRASAAARAAAQLVNVNFGALRVEEGKS
ncbi:IST1-like protein [Chenopodium quinoa]|uniref:IST1-like protein n=1 Tax=Chenopodium quinoa TaxID=63459 RepID=UPI000B776065|nr:IST1-like protein [Chenopodium quinoa]